MAMIDDAPALITVVKMQCLATCLVANWHALFPPRKYTPQQLTFGLLQQFLEVERNQAYLITISYLQELFP